MPRAIMARGFLLGEYMAWGAIASIAGPQGEQGPTGEQGPPGETGATGPTGPAGEGISIAGSVADYASLPSDLDSGDAGDAYYNEDDGLLYVWSGSSFPSDGNGVEFRGPEGPAGPTGETGATGPTGSQGIQGATGSTGAQGDRGATWFTCSGAPGTISGQAVGDLYLDTDDGSIYKLS